MAFPLGCGSPIELQSQGLSAASDVVGADASASDGAPVRRNRQALRPLRRLAKKLSDRLDERGVYGGQLRVKFADGSRVRAVRGELGVDPRRTADDDERLLSFQLEPRHVQGGLVQARAVLARWPNALIESGVGDPLPDEDERRLAAEDRVGHQLADLHSWIAINLRTTDLVETQRAIDALAALDVVESVYAAPRTSAPRNRPACTDWGTPTPNFEFATFAPDSLGQIHLLAPSTITLAAGIATHGHDVKFAWNVPGGRGLGSSLIDVEGGFFFDHEDLPDIQTIEGDNIYGQDHGTATFGVIAGCAGGFGIQGIATQTFVRHSSPDRVPSWSVGRAINEARKRLTRGDVIVIEQEGWDGWIPGACRTAQPESQQGVFCRPNWMPMENWGLEKDNIQLAAADGIIVVEPSANGGVDLTTRVPRVSEGSPTDSGAIMVGAVFSGADSSGGHDTAYFSSAGPRVDLSAWGDKVQTLGYGADLVSIDDDSNQSYTDDFGGTSSASAIIGGAFASLVGMHRALNGHAFVTPYRLRDFLTRVGHAQPAWIFAANRVGATLNHGMAAATYQERLVGDNYLSMDTPIEVGNVNGINIHTAAITNGQVAYRTLRGGAWTVNSPVVSWTHLPAAGFGSNRDLSMLASATSNRIELFVRDINGDLFTNVTTTIPGDVAGAANYTGWSAFPLDILATGVTPIRSGAQWSELFSVTWNGALWWQSRWDGNQAPAWQSQWASLPTQRSLSHTTRMQVVSASPNSAESFTQDVNGNLVHARMTRDPNGFGVTWQGWNILASNLTLDSAITDGTDVYLVAHTSVDVQIGRFDAVNAVWQWTSVPSTLTRHAVVVPFQANGVNNPTRLKLVTTLESGLVRMRTIRNDGVWIGEGNANHPWVNWASVSFDRSLRVVSWQNNVSLVFARNGSAPMFRVIDAVLPTQ